MTVRESRRIREQRLFRRFHGNLQLEFNEFKLTHNKQQSKYISDGFSASRIVAPAYTLKLRSPTGWLWRGFKDAGVIQLTFSSGYCIDTDNAFVKMSCQFTTDYQDIADKFNSRFPTANIILNDNKVFGWKP